MSCDKLKLLILSQTVISSDHKQRKHSLHFQRDLVNMQNDTNAKLTANNTKSGEVEALVQTEIHLKLMQHLPAQTDSLESNRTHLLSLTHNRVNRSV